MSEKNGFLDLITQIDSFIFHPLTLGLCGFAVFCAILVFVMNNTKTGKPNPLKFSETVWLNFVYWFAIFFAPILAIIFVSILAMLAKVGVRILTDNTTGILGQNNLRWYVLSFVGLLTALGGIIGTPLALIRVHTTERQTKTAEKNLITDTLNKAVTNLGAEKTVRREANNEFIEKSVPALEVRSGGLLALERLARDNHDFHIEVMEILTAYIRHNAQAYVEYKGEIDAPIRPRDDLITALSVLSRRTEQQRRIEKDNRYKLQLNDTSFAGLILSNRDLSGIVFDRTDFIGSSLDRVNFSNSSLVNTDFEKVTLRRCRIKEITTAQTNFSAANFINMYIEISEIENGFGANAFAKFNFCKINFNEKGAHYLAPMEFSNCSFESNCLINKSENYIAKCAFRRCDFKDSGVQQKQLNAAYGAQNCILPTELKTPKHWEDEYGITPSMWHKHIEEFKNNFDEIPF
ncbi:MULTISPECIES: pentapeptide repeat-containing protein [Pacificibacter]|uniref:pentapeptide repeat-containing protein n=1 Tax=Pacificibacter TaxID=1042323 RepID=UPI001C0A0A8E|nr:MULTISPECIES: pentapeptide repeat-containing protein [Pacificibacter]MBU2935250.1 pentapeptide repeat-containing protein [Pacificibacter marinus]MDO6615404.1 pentapeptide repeat-containing protein [Pacificibacter sp. 1_MG-2023]